MISKRKKMSIPKFCPRKVYYSTVYIRDVSGKNKSTVVNIGERRKNVAIVLDSDYKGKYLIDGKNEIIYRPKFEDTDSRGFGIHTGFNCTIQRTITGYYVVTRVDYYRKINVGKDDQDIEEESYIVLDEDGMVVQDISLEESGYGRYPFELGHKLIAYDNVCYDIESLKPIFTIPSKFRICSVVENGIMYLEVPGDRREIVVAVHNHEIINQYSVEEFLSLKKGLQVTKKTLHGRLLEKGEKCLMEYGSIVFSNLLFDRSVTLDNSTTSELTQKEIFENLKTIEQKHVEILGYIYNALKASNHCRTSEFGAERYVVCLTNRIIVLLYENVLVLTFYGESRSRYRFFSLDGKALHDGVFYSLEHSYLFRDKVFKRCIFIMENAQTEEKCLIYSLPNKIRITKIPHHINVRDCFGYLEMSDKKTGEKWECDYNFNKLSTKYTMCHVVPVINNYLYSLQDLFLYKGSFIKEIKEHEIIYDIFSPDKILKNGELLLPLPKSYQECLTEIEARHNNRHNFISTIEKLVEYEINGDVISFYKFICEPWAYCDENGCIYYDFDCENIDLVSK